jgi:CheY-like chemotaxis protein
MMLEDEGRSKLDKAILCVDDDALITYVLKQELKQRFGELYFIEIASSGAEGLDLIEELAAEGIEVALVLSDWQMPGMKGDDFLAAVEARRPGIPAVLITGQADRGSIRGAYDRGLVVAHLMKPWKNEELVSLVQRLLPQSP